VLLQLYLSKHNKSDIASKSLRKSIQMLLKLQKIILQTVKPGYETCLSEMGKAICEDKEARIRKKWFVHNAMIIIEKE